MYISENKQNSLITTYSNIIYEKESGFHIITDKKNVNKSFLYFAPIASTSWILGIVIPYEEAMTSIKEFNIKLLFWGIFGLIIIGIVIYLTAKKIARPIIFLTEYSELIAAGQLDKASETIDLFYKNEEIPSSNKNEIVRLMDANVKMINNLKSLISKVSDSINLVSNSSKKITNSINIFETSIDNQNNASEKISQVADEVTTGITEIAGAMNNITGTSEKVENVLTDGMSNLNYINNATNNLMQTAKEINEKLNLISNNTSNITNVIITITKVVNQTNLLSLNAAIEAEKAGEYGIGFSVVAKEIRKLADQTATAALDIENMIETMKIAVEDGVKTVKQYTIQSVESYDKIVKTGESLTEMISQTKSITQEIGKINNEIQSYKKHSVNINNSIDVINKTAENNVSNVLEFSKIAYNLKDSVISLQKEISTYTQK